MKENSLALEILNSKERASQLESDADRQTYSADSPRYRLAQEKAVTFPQDFQAVTLKQV